MRLHRTPLVFASLAAACLLGGCNFIAGVGMDIEDASRSVERWWEKEPQPQPQAAAPQPQPAASWSHPHTRPTGTPWNTPHQVQPYEPPANSVPYREPVHQLEPRIPDDTRSGYTRPAASVNQWPS